MSVVASLVGPCHLRGRSWWPCSQDEYYIFSQPSLIRNGCVDRVNRRKHTAKLSSDWQSDWNFCQHVVSQPHPPIKSASRASKSKWLCSNHLSMIYLSTKKTFSLRHDCRLQSPFQVPLSSPLNWSTRATWAASFLSTSWGNPGCSATQSGVSWCRELFRKLWNETYSAINFAKSVAVVGRLNIQGCQCTAISCSNRINSQLAYQPQLAMQGPRQQQKPESCELNAFCTGLTSGG